jgi:hypothetical protein
VAEHFIHVEQKPGVTRVMQFRGVSVPRVGEVMKLSSPNQQIEGEWEVIDVKWIVTNRAHGTSKYTSEAQAEVWVRRPAPSPKGRRWPWSTVVLLALLSAIAGGAAVMQATAWGWIP